MFLDGDTTYIHIGNTYAVPENSTHYNIDPFDKIEDDLAKLPHGSKAIVCGDTNSHTNVALDYCINDIAGNDGDLGALQLHETRGDIELIEQLHQGGLLKRHTSW